MPLCLTLYFMRKANIKQTLREKVNGNTLSPRITRRTPGNQSPHVLQRSRFIIPRSLQPTTRSIVITKKVTRRPSQLSEKYNRRINETHKAKGNMNMAVREPRGKILHHKLHVLPLRGACFLFTFFRGHLLESWKIG